jgi:flagellin
MSAINTNINANLAANALTKNERAMSQTMERLSTGLRINSAQDDAAGLGIATKMTSQVNGLNQAVRNANDGISMIATADGAAVEITDMLQRMRELAVQAASETVSAADVTNINVEFKQLAVGIEQIADNTQFNGMNILNGTGRSGVDTDGTFTFQLGSNNGQTEALEFNDFQLAGGAAVAAVAGKMDFAGITATALALAKTNDTDITFDINGTAATLDVSTVGSAGSKAVLEIAMTDSQAHAATTSTIMTFQDKNDVDYALAGVVAWTAVSDVVAAWNTAHQTTSGLTASEVLSAAGATTHFRLTETNTPTAVIDVSADWSITGVDTSSVWVSNGANGQTTATDSTVATLSVAQAAAALGTVDGHTFTANGAGGVLQSLQATGTTSATHYMTSSLGAGVETTAGVTLGVAGVMGADLSGMVAASATITATTASILTTLDTAMTGIESQRAKYGAMQNRLTHAVDNLTNVSQNSSASLSRVQDADYAAETTELARTQIISQAATAMLSQANQQAQSVLALLK